MPQRRNRSLLADEHAFLLRQIEIAASSRVEPLLDRIIDALRAGDVVVGDANSVLRHQHLEIGIGNGGIGRQRHHIAVKAIGIGGLFRRQRGVAVLAPEIDLVARAQRRRIGGGVAPEVRQTAGAGSGRLGTGVLHAAVQDRQQGCSCGARLRVGLNDSRRCSRNIEIDGLRLLHQRRQLARAERAPPIQRRRRCRILAARKLVARRNLEGRIGQIRLQDAAGRHRRQRERDTKPETCGEPYRLHQAIRPRTFIIAHATIPPAGLQDIAADGLDRDCCGAGG